MPDIFLFPGAAQPHDIILRDPTVAGGATVWQGSASVAGVAIVSAVGDIVGGGTVWDGTASVTAIALASGVGRSTYAVFASIVGVAVVSAVSPPLSVLQHGKWIKTIIDTDLMDQLVEDEDILLMLV